jgi:sigma-B regulation protein RsbU (phosphoserine phosphatase)
MIRRANELLYQDMASSFVTLFLGRIDTTSGVLCYASAGHPAELRRHDGSFELLSTKEPPLGIESDTLFEVRQTQLHIGDTLFVYTDGISERLSQSREDFGSDRVRDSVTASSNLTASQSIDRLFDAATDFAGHTPAMDDMTAIIVKVVHRLLTPALQLPRSPGEK